MRESVSGPGLPLPKERKPVQRIGQGLAKRLRKPAGASDALLRFSGQVLLLRGFEPLINRRSGRFLDCLDDLLFFHSTEVVGGGSLPPITGQLRKRKFTYAKDFFARGAVGLLSE